MQRELRRVVLAACVIMFTEGFYGTMSFPFASFMVEYLRGTSEHLGTMTGVWMSAFPIGYLITARMWGSVANAVGRRCCLLISLCSSTVLVVAIAVCPSYDVVVLLRFAQGLMNCTLPMARTCLREKVDQLKGDEVQAFSLLQAAFAASSVLGPAVGGLVYGWPANQDSILPWAFPHFLATCSYLLSLVCTYAYMSETLDLAVPSDLRRQQSRQVALFDDASIVYFLVMVAGHSYVFTGWEVGYPLVARDHNLEGWTTAMIGCTFLVGSVGLLLHTLFTYPITVKKMGLKGVWSWSWTGCIVVLIAFPRMLNALLARGFDGPTSWTITLANYVAQLFVSVLQGCNFTTLQLMLNRLIKARSNGDYALPLANGWMVSLQGLARAISPVMTGSLVAQNTVFNGVLAFDALAGIAIVCCLFFGWMLHRRLDSSAFAREDVVGADGYQKMMDEDSKSVEIRPSPGDTLTPA